MKNLIADLVGYAITIILFPFLLAFYYLYWQPHDRQAHFKAANCKDYLNMEHGTEWTTEEIGNLYRAQLLLFKAGKYRWN
jgi:hypothetical protein